jgi:hypothetical protein
MLLFLNLTLTAVVFCHCWNSADASSLLYEPPYYGTVRTVVWEEGGGDSASYPVQFSIVDEPAAIVRTVLQIDNR